jgi:hypothetical protein
LHGGHYFNLVWSFQLFYVLPTVLAGVVLALIFTSNEDTPLRTLVAAAGCLFVAALAGGPGIFYVPPIALWLVYAAWHKWRSGKPGGKLKAIVVAISAVAAVAPLVFYVIHLAEAVQTPPVRVPGSVGPLLGSIQFLTVGPGVLDNKLWPLTAIVLVALIGLALWRLFRVWRLDPLQRITTVGLALFVVAVLGLAAGIGISRSHMSPWACVVDRYVTLSVMLVLALYLIGVRYGRTIASPRLRWGLVAVLLALTVRYDHHGYRAASDLHLKIARLENSVRDGLPPEAVATRCCWDMQDPEIQLVDHLRLLREARLGPYRQLPAGVRERTASVSLTCPFFDPERISGEMRLSADEYAVQRLTPRASLPLYRIDLEIQRRRGAAAGFAWTLDEVAGSGRRTSRASGHYRFEDGADPDYAAITFPPVQAEPGAAWELALSEASDQKAATHLVLPVSEYPVGDRRESGIRGFLYFGQPPDKLAR